MRKEEKIDIINDIKSTIEEYNHFYLTDIAELDAEKTSSLRRQCFKSDIKLVVVKNTLLKKALEDLDADVEELYAGLKGNSAVMFCNTGNAPAKLIKDFRKGSEKPVLKGAYVEECIYMGEGQLEALVNIKSREELIGEIVGLLQSPMKNVLSGLQSGGNTIHGVLETLANK